MRKNPRSGFLRRIRWGSFLPALLLVAGITTGASLAYLRDETLPVENRFTPGTVTCQVEEDFDGTVKSSVSVKNTGSTQSYIRAVVNVTWVDSATGTIMATLPQPGRDYTILFSQTGWIQGSDGFWYCIHPVAPGATTPTLIHSCTGLSGAVIPEGCQLSVEIVASAIQSDPADAVQQKWNVRVQPDGTLSPEVTQP